MTKTTYVLLNPSLRAVGKRHAQERGVCLSAYLRELVRADGAVSRGCNRRQHLAHRSPGLEGAPTDIARESHETFVQAFAEEVREGAAGEKGYRLTRAAITSSAR